MPSLITPNIKHCTTSQNTTSYLIPAAEPIRLKGVELLIDVHNEPMEDRVHSAFYTYSQSQPYCGKRAGCSSPAAGGRAASRMENRREQQQARNDAGPFKDPHLGYLLPKGNTPQSSSVFASNTQFPGYYNTKEGMSGMIQRQRVTGGCAWQRRR